MPSTAGLCIIFNHFVKSPVTNDFQKVHLKIMAKQVNPSKRESCRVSIFFFISLYLLQSLRIRLLIKHVIGDDNSFAFSESPR